MAEFRHQRHLTVFLLGCLLVIASAFWWLAHRSPGISYFASHPPAQWIVYPAASDGAGLPAIELSSEFRRTFTMDSAPSEAKLSVRAFKRCQIAINGTPVDTGNQTNKNWKDASVYDVHSLLHAGTNEISVTVTNDYGPPALWLSLDAGAFRLSSDESWQASYAGAAWHPARLAQTPLEIGRGHPLDGGETLAGSLTRQWPRLLMFAAISVLLLLAGRWWLNHSGGHPQFSPLFAPQRWPVLAIAAMALAWATMWANNMALLPPQTGFDVVSHLEYVNYILEKHRLPLPNEGFEMYQPPLYYLFSAGLLWVFHLNALDPNGIIVLRVFGLICGIATFSLVFASARLLFPDQPRKQFFALLLGALLPANLYIYQYATNELLATTMAALSVYLCLRILTNPALSARQHAWLGLAMGGALLTKTSTVVLPPVIFAALVWNLCAKSDRKAGAWAKCLGLALLVCVVTAGWHYGRIAAHFGNPLIGNWDAASGFLWWQQAGYRTSSYYTHFGRSLTEPLFSSFGGFGDGVYSTLWGDSLYGGHVEILFRPPWNYDFMVAGYLFALLPTLAIILGAAAVLVGFLRKPGAKGFLLLGLTSLLALLLFYYSFKVPVYASNKAFYASAALVPVCLLGAAGWNILCRALGRIRVIAYVLLGVWAITTYTAFWIQRDAPHTQGLIARNFSDAERHDLAAARLTEALQQHPHDPELTLFLLLELLVENRLTDAQVLAEQTLPYHETDADLHLLLGQALANQGQFEGAVAEAKRAVELAPDHYSAEQELAEWLKSAGHKTEALAACREALRMKPTGGRLRYLLGSLLAESGDTTNAPPQLRLAATLEPDFTAAHERLGVVLMNLGQLDEAASHLTTAVKLSPSDPGCRCRLAQALAEQDKITPAIESYREALNLNPHFLPALGDLAWQLATYPDPKIRNGGEALELATQACDLSGHTNAQYLETLSAADAEAGRFDEALTNVNKALGVAEAAGDIDIVESCRNLIPLYQARKPYRQAEKTAATEKR